jgi:purine-cytosine permease-like protein
VKTVNFLGRRIPVPASVILRVGLGMACILGGVLGFLPVLGYWMLPLGLLILSIDFPWVRRFRRRLTVRAGPAFLPVSVWAAGATVVEIDKNGGLGGNRTPVQGFAVLCVTTPPRGPIPETR